MTKVNHLNYLSQDRGVLLRPAEKDKYAPEDFYSTTNYTTKIFYNNRWVDVEDQRMDALIVVDENGARCKKLRDIKAGEYVVCGDDGIKVITENNDADNETFSFMDNFVSSERKNDIMIRELAEELFYKNKKLTIVAGPVVVHTGGDHYISQLIRDGYVSSLLTGNALAVHDIEKSFFGTSLGVCEKTGKVTKNGYRNHMRAINKIMKHGSIKKAVENRELKSGIMYECIKNNIPFVLAGSLRDDGPLPDTITDMIAAQDAYNKQLINADVVIVLGSMLHGIATGNMLPARIKMICVDINSAVVTKLSDRGSSQAVGIVTDVGLFLNILVNHLESLKSRYIPKYEAR